MFFSVTQSGLEGKPYLHLWSPLNLPEQDARLLLLSVPHQHAGSEEATCQSCGASERACSITSLAWPPFARAAARCAQSLERDRIGRGAPEPQSKANA